MQYELSGSNRTDCVTSIAPLRHYYDNVTNDSDKSWTVPAGETWKLCMASTRLASTATAGNRQMRLTLTDASGGLMGYYSAGAVQAASLARNYMFMQGVARETSFVDSVIQVSIPVDCWLPPGATVRFWDSAAIDAAADDLTVGFTVQVFKGVQ